MSAQDGTDKGLASPPAFFIGGSGRSGTSILMDLLNCHRDIAAVPYETRVAADDALREFPAAMVQCPAAGRRKVTQFIKNHIMSQCFRFQVDWQNATRDGWRGWHMWIDRQGVEDCLPLLDRMETAASEAASYVLFGQFLDALFGRHAEKEGKRHWLEKTPVNSIHADFLYKCFPHMRLLTIVRDGRDVACSVVKQPWGADNHPEALDWWAGSLFWTVDAQKRIPEETYLNIRYEDLILRPVRTLHQVVDFLGVDWDDNLLSIQLSSASIGRWQRDMPPEAVRYARNRYGDMLTALGYTFSEDVAA